MITGKNRVAPHETQVIAEMSRCPNCIKCPAAALDSLSVGNRLIGSKRQIHTFTSTNRPLCGKPLHHVTAARLTVAIGKHRCASRLGKRRCKGRVIKVGMGDKDMTDRLPGCQC